MGPNRRNLLSTLQKGLAMKKVYCKCGEIIRFTEVPADGLLTCPTCQKKMRIRQPPEEILFEAKVESAAVRDPDVEPAPPKIRLELLEKPRNLATLERTPLSRKPRFWITLAGIALASLFAYALVSSPARFSSRDIIPRPIATEADAKQCELYAAQLGLVGTRVQDCIYFEDTSGFAKIFPGESIIATVVESPDEPYPVVLIKNPAGKVPFTRISVLLNDSLVAQLKADGEEEILELVMMGIHDPVLKGERGGDWDRIVDQDALAAFMVEAFDDIQKFKRR